MADVSSPKARVLIAEDVHVLAMVMQRPLEKAGYAVEVAVDGEECLRRTIESPPDVLLLDIMMPKMHGIAVLKALRADPRTCKLPVIMCSAKDFKTERAEAAALGACAFLLKPPPPDVLVAAVEAAIIRKGE